MGKNLDQYTIVTKGIHSLVHSFVRFVFLFVCLFVRSFINREKILI